LQTYYYALDAVERIKTDPQMLSSQHDLLEAQKLSSEGVLMNLGLGRPQLEDLARSRKLTQEIILSAPATILSWPGTSPRAKNSLPVKNSTGWLIWAGSGFWRIYLKMKQNMSGRGKR
jgi:hypothetical protein